MSDLDLGREALLYLADELDPPRRQSFERRLETDAEAQVQLALAVELTELLRGRSARPDASYRDAVRASVLPRPRSRPWLGVRVWAEFAVALCLLLATWSVARIDSPQAETTPPPVAGSKPEPEPGGGIALHDEIDERIDMATAWAEMSNLEHYQQATEDDQRRRSRSRESGLLLIPALMEEHGLASE
jgi:hypothetical protein